MLSAIVKEPIYHQLNSHLRQLTTSGECPIGDEFLTERQICERHEVSQAIAAGKPPSSRVLHFENVSARDVLDEVPQVLQTGPDGRLFHVEGADQRVRAVNLRGAEARALHVRDGAAGLLVSSVGYLTGGGPLWSERTLHRGTLTSFTAGSAESSQRAMRRASFWKQAKRRAE